MALDGIYLSLLKKQIEAYAGEARIDKISQPTRESLVIALRWRGGSGKLLLSAGADAPRIHFTQKSPENPKAAPMFCMLLRKHLGSGKLMEIQQFGCDRILHLTFQCINELGDLVLVTVAMEIMGRHSNIILMDQDGKIIDAIKRISPDMSAVRPVLPGMQYQLPPAQNKQNIYTADGVKLAAEICRGKERPLHKAILETVEGLSPIISRELAYYTSKTEKLTTELTPDEETRLTFAIGQLQATLAQGGQPTAVYQTTGKPMDFAFMPIHQYGHAMLTKPYEDVSTLLDDFYEEKDRVERTRQRSGDLLRLLINTSERISRKLEAQKLELAQSVDRDQLRLYGDLLNANLYRMQKGESSITVENFFADDAPPITIPLDLQLNPAQNAQRYYAQYHKAATAEQKLRQMIASGAGELMYIDSVFDALTRASLEAELVAIRQELGETGYLRLQKQKGRGQAKPDKLPPLRYQSSDGFTILCGRNNVQNDRLTLKDSQNHDLWLHTQKIPGSHTVIVCDGKEPPNRTIEEAAIIAAYNSKARTSSKVAVDYTQIRFVKKPAGAKPGMVVYDPYQTAIVTPDEALLKSLRQD